MEWRQQLKTFRLAPTIKTFDTCKDFCNHFEIGEQDLLIVSEHTYKDYLSDLVNGAKVIFLRNYGQGEPSDLMVEAMYEDIKAITYKRVIAIGGGSILDVAKLFVLKEILPVCDLFDGKMPFAKDKELILVPTTCGTGSEVTNISILELTKKSTKKGLAVDELYADCAVLIPELLEGLPFRFFVSSSVDAFIHAIESYLSPKATPLSEMYSLKAMELIIKGYMVIKEKGEEARGALMEEFLLASTYAGIAFGNAGCAAVHALSYPLGATYHVAHGEANYAIWYGVFTTYQQLKPQGKMQQLSSFLSDTLACEEAEVYHTIDALIQTMLPKKSLREYGVSKEQLEIFSQSVMENQKRLMANNYTELDYSAVYRIYESLY